MHALRQRLGPEALAVFETGARYQMVHALALLFVGMESVRMPRRALTVAGWLFAAVSAFIAAAVALAWTGLAFYLGARMKSWTRDDARSSPRSLQQQR